MYSQTCWNFHKLKHAFPIAASLIAIGYCVFSTIQQHYSLYNITLFFYADLILAHYCKRAFQKLPPREKSLNKSLLRFAFFLLSSGNLFAIATQSAPHYGPLTAAWFYGLAVAGTAFFFYAFVIHESEEGLTNCSAGGFSLVESNSYLSQQV